MTQTSRLSKNNTKVLHNGLGMVVMLHDTIIVQFSMVTEMVILNSGGGRTATTKTRINQFANEYCQGRFSVQQTKGEWYVTRYGPLGAREVLPFEDGMEFKL